MSIHNIKICTMKIKIYSIAFLFAISLLFASCRKDNRQQNPDNNIDNFLDLKISESFDFESFSNLETSIKLASTKATGFEIIQIYDAHPNKGGKLIISGSANENGVFDLPLRIASRLTEVYVAKLSASGANEYVAVPVKGSTIQFDFSTDNSKTVSTWCDCAANKTLADGFNSDLTIGGTETWCVDYGDFVTIKKLRINPGGTLNICGDATIKQVMGGSYHDGYITISPTGSANIKKGGIPHYLDNYGTLNLSSDKCDIKGTLNNYFNISSTVKVEIKDGGKFTNEGNFTTDDEVKIKNTGELINECQFYIISSSKSPDGSKQDFEQSGQFTNNGYMKVEDEAEFTGTGNKKTTLGDGSLIETKDFKINGEIVGASNPPAAQIKASDDGDVNSGADITNVDLCANDPDYNNNATYTNVTYCVNNVTAPSCDINVAPDINSSLNIGGIAGQAISPYTITASGTSPITYNATDLPSGLTFDGTTITGTVASPGTYNITITATNLMGTDTETLELIITQPTAAPVITSALTETGTINQPINYLLEASGTGPITYAATNLPAGLSFDPATQRITGSTATADVYNILVSASNAGGTTTETLVLTVGAPPTITNALTASGTAGVQFSTFTVTAEGTDPITYSASNLPPGLSFNPNNQTINGTPTTPGDFDVTLTANNDHGTDVEILVITIGSGLVAPTITSDLTANGTKNFPFSYTIAADGSTPMTWSASGNIPAGLTLSGNVLSGTPIESGTFNITIGAHNDAGDDTKVLVITIGTGGTTDTDGDGVPDNEDAYPNDATRAFNSYYPNEVDFGSFAFEDLWPGYGDYDFNDFVVNFNYTIVTNAQNKIVDVITKFQIMADGASQNNGFGIEFDVPSSTVESVTGCMKFGNTVSIDPKGFEMGHSNTTVIIPFDAINTIMEGGMVNTIPGGRYIQTTVSTVTTHFQTPQDGIGTPPFNPFIFVDQVRGYEIHLKNQPPTDLVDEDYFDTYHDASNPPTTYYVSETGLPWGIEVPINFNYPVEKADILTAHLKFAAWAQSAGVDYPDWYEDKTGYRNDANIYVVP